MVMIFMMEPNTDSGPRPHAYPLLCDAHSLGIAGDSMRLRLSKPFVDARMSPAFRSVQHENMVSPFEWWPLQIATNNKKLRKLYILSTKGRRRMRTPRFLRFTAVR
jgi:hypothetical protein